ncbi:hypothetical protein [Chroococcidiopsis sp.]|uniref:hypothetical protein n=1 Tax=Chroococcidiopsis sp. TaxID=3088168 RepID=UPI003F3FE122
MEFNPTNAFGELLLDLIESQYQGDIDAGVEGLMQSTGLGEEEIVAIIQGDTIIEDEQLLSDIIEAFPDADEDDLEVIIQTATEVDEADRNALIEEIDANEAELEAGAAEGGELGEGGEGAASYGYHYNPSYRAEFAAQQAASRVSAVEAQLADFQAYSALNGELRSLDQHAQRYVDAGAMPPSIKSMLIGNFSDDASRLAQFQSVAANNGVDVPTMLFATQYALGMLSDASDFVEFRDHAITDEDVAIASFSASLDTMVSADIDAIFGS